MTWIKISNNNNGTYAREVDNPVEVKTIDELDAEIAKLEASLAEVAEDFVHDDKGYEEYINIERQKQRDIIAPRLTRVKEIKNNLCTL